MALADMNFKSTCRSLYCESVPQPGHSKGIRAIRTVKLMSRALGKVSLSGTGLARASNAQRIRPMRVTATGEVSGGLLRWSTVLETTHIESRLCWQSCYVLMSRTAGQGVSTERQFSKAAAKVGKASRYACGKCLYGLNGLAARFLVHVQALEINLDPNWYESYSETAHIMS